MKTIVIGGGAAGLIAAYFSAKKGDKTILIEKNEKLGKKIFITGKGRCNVTNLCEPQDFLNSVVNNARFLSGAIYGFTPRDMMDLLEENGLPLKVERGNRVFPVSDKSSDVIKTLANMCKFAGVEVLLNQTVEGITAADGKVSGVKTDLGDYTCDKVIVATGGVSYALTGSTGDGYTFAKALGHKIIPPVQALAPMKIKGDYPARLAGLSLKNVTLNVTYQGKLVSSEFGEMLFTHQGVSGPIVLTTTSKINRLDKKDLSLAIDFKPALDEKTLDNRLIREFSAQSARAIKNVLDQLLPMSLIPVVIERTGIAPDKKAGEISRAERQSIIRVLKGFTLDLESFAPFSEAIVTAGGVSVKEVNPKTMESKLIKGLYFAGEVLDVDAYTGGFNLQIAFATGARAGS